jgi:Dolichyl-phosphate-mannose-protein mannosyltransferase
MRKFWTSRSGFERALLLIFVLTIPFIHPSVFSDGRGYYAYLRSPLIDHNLRFAGDWNSPPLTELRDCTVCSARAKQYWNHPANQLLLIHPGTTIYVNPITKTGYLPNFYTVGPAILWAPFVAVAHLAVLGADALGLHIPPDGHSWPYVAALSFATAIYGFLGLYFSFQLAKSFVKERWAFWATLGIWFGSSLPTAMYLEPSWSHTHSAFCVAWFLWYWHRTRAARTWKQWLAMGLIAGLMMDVYLANGVFLLAPAVDCVADYWRSRQSPRLLWEQFRSHLIFAASCIVAFSPMLITRRIIFGNALTLGMYANVPWNWKTPVFWAVLFSAKHGVFICTPILLLAVLGLFAVCRTDFSVGTTLLLLAGAFYCLISVYPWWDGVYSFGNRFFISLTPIFIVGLAAAFSWAARLWTDSKTAVRRLAPLTVLLILWNFGLIYQWSHYLFFPEGVGDVSWSEVVYNQFRVVPEQLLREASHKFSQSRLAHDPDNGNEKKGNAENEYRPALASPVNRKAS